MSEGPAFPFERDFVPPVTGGASDAWMQNLWSDFSMKDFRWRPVGESGADAAALIGDINKVHFTTAASDAAQHVEPDFILGKDGKLQRNPKKTEPNPDGSITIEVASDNTSELAATKAANELQRAWARDMIQRWQNAPEHQGEQVPQEWLDLINAQDAPGPQQEGGQPPRGEQPPQQEAEPSPQDFPSSNGGTSSGGGYAGGDYGGGGGGSGGGGAGGGGYERPSSTGGDGTVPQSTDRIPNQPTTDNPLPDVPGPTPPGEGLSHFQQAIDRARSGGEPVRVLQYGDSHIVQGTEAKSIEQSLDQLAPTNYSTMAKGGISANYPLSHPQEWLDAPLQQNNPDLVILSFGSNDAAGPVDKDSYMQMYQKLIDNIHQRSPNADIVICGPTDGDSIVGANKGNTLPGLDTVIEAQKEIAARNHLQFVDQRAMMGGPGSIEQWHDKGLSAGDKLHFSAEGYGVLGESIANHIKNALEKK